MEYRFVINFNQRIIDEKRKSSRAEKGLTTFALNNESWIEQNLYVGKFTIEAGSDYENVMLKDTDFRSKYGLIIIGVLRDDEELASPNGDFILKSGDLIIVVGNIMQINRLTSDKNKIVLNRETLKTIHIFSKNQDKDPNSKIKCISLIIDKESGLYGKSLLESEMGRRGKCFVVGIERSSGYEINPPASAVFMEDDIIWIVGQKDSIYAVLRENFNC